MAVEYEFDGLDLWEQRLAQAVEKQYPEEFRKMVIDVAVELEGRVKERTPVKTGHLRREWHVGNIEKRSDGYYIEVITTWSMRSRWNTGIVTERRTGADSGREPI